jgi:hypothetical protein
MWAQGDSIAGFMQLPMPFGGVTDTRLREDAV